MEIKPGESPKDYAARVGQDGGADNEPEFFNSTEMSDLLKGVNIYAEERKAVIFEHTKQRLREKLYVALGHVASELADLHKQSGHSPEEAGERLMAYELEEVAVNKMLTLITHLDFSMEIKQDDFEI